MRIRKLLVAISFHFVAERLKYLRETTRDLSSFADEVHLVVVTNASDGESHRQISEHVPQLDRFDIAVPALLGHPFLLTWVHRNIFKTRYEEQEDISHFLYIEDDIKLTSENIAYWLEGREKLLPFGLIPSFLRYELKDGSTQKLATDITGRVFLPWLPRVRISSDYHYINLPEPYQGCYLLDRELAGEHLFGPSSSPDFGPWNIREKAAQGVTFLDVPKGSFSRNFLGVKVADGTVDSRATIHHIANNYANDPMTKFGKVPIDRIFTGGNFFPSYPKKASNPTFIHGKALYRFYLTRLKSLVRRVVEFRKKN